MVNRSQTPNKAIMGVPDLSVVRAKAIAVEAARLCRVYAPKATVQSASRFLPIYGEGFFGVKWEHPYVWFQETGIRPFTMRSLAGKTIPMWVNDPTGETQRKNPKAETRRLADGRVQVKIFRKAAMLGQRKNVPKIVNGVVVMRNVPASYPGAPGRIAVNRSQGIIRQGDIDPSSKNPGWIAKGNVGVRWRHPGLNPRRFLARGLTEAAITSGIPVADVKYLNQWNGGTAAVFTPIIYSG